MDIKAITLVSLLLFSSILFSACPKESINLNRSFEAKFYYSPQKKQFTLGDTLWLESTFSCKSLVNLATGKVEEFCGAKNLGTTLHIYKLDTTGTNGVIQAVDSVNILNVKGRTYSAGTDYQNKGVKQIAFEQIDTNYAVKCGIIPLKKGKYYLGVANGISNGGDCEKASYSFTVGNTENNVDIYLKHRGINVISDYELLRGYWFEVK
jgi:hypothetical protein